MSAHASRSPVTLHREGAALALYGVDESSVTTAEWGMARVFFSERGLPFIVEAPDGPDDRWWCGNMNLSWQGSGRTRAEAFEECAAIVRAWLTGCADKAAEAAKHDRENATFHANEAAEKEKRAAELRALLLASYGAPVPSP